MSVVTLRVFQLCELSSIDEGGNISLFNLVFEGRLIGLPSLYPKLTAVACLKRESSESELRYPVRLTIGRPGDAALPIDALDYDVVFTPGKRRFNLRVLLDGFPVTEVGLHRFVLSTRPDDGSDPQTLGAALLEVSMAAPSR